MSGPDRFERWEPEGEGPGGITFICSRCGIAALPTGDGTFPEWSGLVARRRDGASLGALDVPLDICPLCLSDFRLWFAVAAARGD
jgi:hypothetical protein